MPAATPTPRTPTWSSSPPACRASPADPHRSGATNVNVINAHRAFHVPYAPNAFYLLVSNPVDILTYVFQKVSGIPEERIMGSGTLLDTARLRARIAEYLNVSQKNIHAYVLGEHGDSSFIPWSVAQVSTIPLSDYKELIHYKNQNFMELDYDEVEKYMRTSGSKIISRKGATYYAIAISVCEICESLFGSVDAVTTVSTMMHGEYGMEDCVPEHPHPGGPQGRGRQDHPPSLPPRRRPSCSTAPTP